MSRPESFLIRNTTDGEAHLADYLERINQAGALILAAQKIIFNAPRDAGASHKHKTGRAKPEFWVIKGKLVARSEDLPPEILSAVQKFSFFQDSITKALDHRTRIRHNGKTYLDATGHLPRARELDYAGLLNATAEAYNAIVAAIAGTARQALIVKEGNLHLKRAAIKSTGTALEIEKINHYLRILQPSPENHTTAKPDAANSGQPARNPQIKKLSDRDRKILEVAESGARGLKKCALLDQKGITVPTSWSDAWPGSFTEAWTKPPDCLIWREKINNLVGHRKRKARKI